MPAFTDGGGGGEGGGGGGWFGGGGGGGDEGHTWKDYGIFGDAGGDSRASYKKQSWIAENVPGYTRECWRDPECRRTLLAKALEIWIRSKALDPRSDIRRRLESGKVRGITRRYGETAVQVAELARREQLTRASATQPQQQPPVLPTGGPEPAWLRLLRIVAEQVAKYRNEQAAREQQRAQRRGMQMSLSDAIGDVLGTVTQAGATLLPQILQNRAQEQAIKQQLKLARFAGGSMSGVPTALGGAAGLLALLGEQGAMEAPDLLESLGMATGLEGAIEREAVFYVPTASGVRAVPELQARNPVTGRINVWRNMGRPVLYSGDLSTCKRVNRISSRVASVARRRGVVRRSRRR